jgi:hypothetical protein
MAAESRHWPIARRHKLREVFEDGNGIYDACATAASIYRHACVSNLAHPADRIPSGHSKISSFPPTPPPTSARKTPIPYATLKPEERMPTKAEIARANGARSIGPVTLEGKARSSQNSLKHGLAGEAVVLPHDSTPR